MIDISLNSVSLVLSISILVAIVLGIITFIRWRFGKNALGGLANKYQAVQDSVLKNRNKYPEVDAFRMSGTFFNIGMTVALSAVVLAFSWTQYEQKVYIPETLDAFEDLEIVPPTTQHTPPPPPPLPPPVIEEVPEELIEQEDMPDFEDMSIDANSLVAAPTPIKKESVAPPPLPEGPKETAPEIVSFAEEMPRFPGCENLPTTAERKQCADQKMLEFVYKNIKYPAIARENGIEGMAVITFVVETDGSVTAAKVLRDPGGQCGQEALRVVQLMNQKDIQWIPGKQRGRPVRVQFNLPVRFKLE